MPEKSTQIVRQIRRCKILDGRYGFQLRSAWGHVSALEGGGHICEAILNSVGEVNPFWDPTWKTTDPWRYSPRMHGRSYGPPPEGRLLAEIAGHSISFDFFGPPSAEEIAAGLSTHGEAPVVKWRRELNSRTPHAALVYSADLPQAQMRLQRTIFLDGENPVVYCQEVATNRGCFDRPISWNHHVTFGPPFLKADVTLFDMPATRSKVCPASFSSNMSLEPDAKFDWPNAPRKQGGVLDLRSSAKGRYGHYTAHLLDPASQTAFISACNPRLQLLVLYVFKRSDYAWVGNWEESHNREHMPWRGREFCRGFEFSTTPFPLPRRETIKNGPLFGQDTYKWLLAKSSTTSKYLIVLQQIPKDFAGVASVELVPGSLVVHEHAEERTLRVPVMSFL